MYHGGQCLFEKHMELLRIQFQSRRYKAFFLFWLMFSLQTSIVTVTVKGGKKTEKDAGHNPKNNNLTSRSILRQLSQFPQHTWKHGDGPLWVNYFISCTGVLDSYGFYFIFLCNMPSSISTFFWGVGWGGGVYPSQASSIHTDEWLKMVTVDSNVKNEIRSVWGWFLHNYGLWHY